MIDRVYAIQSLINRHANLLHVNMFMFENTKEWESVNELLIDYDKFLLSIGGKNYKAAVDSYIEKLKKKNNV